MADQDNPSLRIRVDGVDHGRATTSLVLGHSRDPVADDALRVAADLARRLHAHLHVVHGVDLSDYPVDPDRPDWEEEARRALAAQRRRVAAVLAGSPGSWTYHAGHGDAAGLLIDVAEETDALMIIVGSHGEGVGATFERLLGGSVSRAVLRRQHRPVLIVPGSGTHPEPEHGGPGNDGPGNDDPGSDSMV
ncbi:hypothetical protein PSD17_13940 [Pseudonocardia sp. D17]|jgi:nucleotide-binding universal stress UspA family protein|nr:hypothetical protein PSD17_13940 [Pseudonocardia sp. D17]